MNLFASLFRRPVKALAGARARPTLEQLEGRDLPSASAFLPNVSGDHLLRIAQAEYVQDHDHLSRTDVINLFDVVDDTKKAVFTDGKVSFHKVSNPDLSTPLSDSAVADLESLVKNSAPWGLTPDVANLAGKVVGYNLANEHYQGATLLTSGKLAAGDPARDMKDLVGKWFYGADLPAIGVAHTTYQKANGSLFGPNGPQASDIAQGDVGDCYFLSSLAETAQQSPQAIKSMFTSDGDGTYTVRFYEYNSTTHTSTADYITVNSELPANSKGQFVYANNESHGQSTNIANNDNVLWVALAEKAYAQLAAEGWSRGTSNAVNAYDSLSIGDNQLASQQITGSTNGAWVSVGNGKSAQASAAFQQLVTDFQNGDVLTACTNYHVPGSSRLDGNHVYYVTAMNAKDQTITLTNPYWTRGKKTVTLTLAKFADYLGGAAVVVP